MDKRLQTAESIPVIEKLNSSKICWGDFGDEDPDELIETWVQMIMEKSMFHLFPEVLDVDRGSETR
jgi:hypothetical protein